LPNFLSDIESRQEKFSILPKNFDQIKRFIAERA